jgi:hypothetical protein
MTAGPKFGESAGRSAPKCQRRPAGEQCTGVPKWGSGIELALVGR